MGVLRLNRREWSFTLSFEEGEAPISWHRPTNEAFLPDFFDFTIRCWGGGAVPFFNSGVLHGRKVNSYGYGSMISQDIWQEELKHGYPFLRDVVEGAIDKAVKEIAVGEGNETSPQAS